VKFTKYLPQYGWQPVIYTPENPEQLALDESLLDEIPAEAEVIKTHITEPYGIYRKLFGGKKKTSTNDGVNPLNSTKKSWKQKIAVWVRGNFFVPDPRVSWVGPSVRFLKKYLAEHPVDAMVTTGPPQSMHLIGLKLKRATGLRWIVDFRDPWTKMYYFKNMGLWPLAERKQRRMEQAVIDECDAVTTITPYVVKDFQDMTSTKVHLLTNGFDEDDFPEVEVQPGEKFTVVHTGLFSADGDPVNLWDALARKCSCDKEFKKALEIRLAGKVDAPVLASIRDRGLWDNLVNLGYLEHSRTVAEQRSASILILPLRQDPEYRKALPGKIFEYLAARRPVLGIGQEDGASAEVLRNTKAGVMYDWTSTTPVSNFIDNQWERFRSGDRGSMDSDISQYSRRALTEKLIEIL